MVVSCQAVDRPSWSNDKRRAEPITYNVLIFGAGVNAMSLPRVKSRFHFIGRGNNSFNEPNSALACLFNGLQGSENTEDSNLRKEKLVVAHSLRVQPIMAERVTEARVRGSWSHDICQQAKSKNCSLLFIQARTPPCEVPHTDKVDRLSSS